MYLPRSIERFKADLDFLLAHYQSISLEELLELNKDGVSKEGNYFHLTFDDGLKEFYSIVAPILRERGVHATVFLNSDFIDNLDLFYRFKASLLYEEVKDESILEISYADRYKLDQLAITNNIDFKKYLELKKPYLTSGQIKELIGQGFTFGAHSKDHPLYKDLDLQAQIAQTKESIDEIVEAFNLTYSVFSFPFTDDGVPKAFFNEIVNDVDFTFGSAGLKEDTAPNHFQRVVMELDKSGKDIIKAEYLYYLMKQQVGKHKIIRK